MIIATNIANYHSTPEVNHELTYTHNDEVHEGGKGSNTKIGVGYTVTEKVGEMEREYHRGNNQGGEEVGGGEEEVLSSNIIQEEEIYEFYFSFVSML